MSIKLLFICTHNRCRSILAEAITNHLGQGKIIAKSAGSQPEGKVHPSSIRFLNEKGINTDELKSQSWDDFEAWQPDLVITVCDSAANETCPAWFGSARQYHWGLKDPSKVAGNDNDIRDAFNTTINIIENGITRLVRQKVNDVTDLDLDDAFKPTVK